MTTIADFLTDIKNEILYCYWYSRGNKLYKLNKLEDAIEAYSQTLRFKPDSIKAHISHSTAVKDLVSKNSQRETWYRQGESLVKSRKFKDAIIAYDNALACDPNDYVAWGGRAIALTRTGKFKEAIKCYDIALQIKPDWDTAIQNRREVYNLYSSIVDLDNIAGAL